MDLRNTRLFKAGLTTITKPADPFTGQGTLNKNGFAAISGDPLTGVV